MDMPFGLLLDLIAVQQIKEENARPKSKHRTQEQELDRLLTMQ